MARACILGKHVLPMGSQGVRAGTDNRASTGSEMIPSGHDLTLTLTPTNPVLRMSTVTSVLLPHVCLSLPSMLLLCLARRFDGVARGMVHFFFTRDTPQNSMVHFFY